jgi:hypothetical protein
MSAAQLASNKATFSRFHDDVLSQMRQLGLNQAEQRPQPGQ